MAKDTEKLIRQLSLISYLMAERRPGHGDGDPARRRGLQRDERGRVRAALLRRPLRARVAGHPADRRAPRRRGGRAGELLAAPGELPPAADRLHRQGARGAAGRAQPARRRIRLRRAAAPGACSRSPGDAPARCARPSSARSRSASPRRPAATSCRRAWRRSRRRSFATRRSCSTTTRWSATRTGTRRVDPYHLLFQGGQFYLLGYAHERKAIRVFRLSRIRGKVSYATKAEHDFRRPEDFDPRAYANRADWQLGDELGVAEILISERIAWQVERHFGRYGEICRARTARGPAVPHRLLQPAQDHLLGARPGRERAPAGTARAGRRAEPAAGAAATSATARCPRGRHADARPRRGGPAAAASRGQGARGDAGLEDPRRAWYEQRRRRGRGRRGGPSAAHGTRPRSDPSASRGW